MVFFKKTKTLMLYFFCQFNFKMKIFPILSHLNYISDQESEIFLGINFDHLSFINRFVSIGLKSLNVLFANLGWGGNNSHISLDFRGCLFIELTEVKANVELTNVKTLLEASSHRVAFDSMCYFPSWKLSKQEQFWLHSLLCYSKQEIL